MATSKVPSLLLKERLAAEMNEAERRRTAATAANSNDNKNGNDDSNGDDSKRPTNSVTDDTTSSADDASADNAEEESVKRWQRKRSEERRAKERVATSGASDTVIDHDGDGAEKKDEEKKVDSLLSTNELPTLPIHASKAELLQVINDNQIIVITGDTGSGKSTQLPQFLYQAGYGKKGLIGVTQPRRIGAMSVAKRVAREMDVQLGEEVGYSIRFEDVCTDKTSIKFMTDGVLLRECLQHTQLAPYSVIVLDEAHERSLQTDILFGVVKNILRTRKDLKLIVTSATLDIQKFSTYFDDCPCFHVPGRCYPVDITHAEKAEKYYVDAAVELCVKIHTTQPMGHILVFLTGQEECDRACRALEKKVDSLFDDGIDMPDIVILPVYANLPSEQQHKIFQPTPPDVRKVLFATNICETSLTVDGVTYVIDPGYVKQKQFDPRSGIESLAVVPISRVAATQRAGRAGRTRPGQCFRLYTEAMHDYELAAESVPEIQRTNLANTVLLLKSLGIVDPLSFEFLDNPSAAAIVDALLSLFYLAAIDADGRITRLGKAMADFPLDPALSKMLITSVALKCRDEILTITAMLASDQLWIRPSSAAGSDAQAEADQKKETFSSKFGDQITLLFVYDSWIASGATTKWCQENFIHYRALKKAQEVRAQLEEILKKYEEQLVRDEKRAARRITNTSSSSNGGSSSHHSHHHTSGSSSSSRRDDRDRRSSTSSNNTNRRDSRDDRDRHSSTSSRRGDSRDRRSGRDHRDSRDTRDTRRRSSRSRSRSRDRSRRDDNDHRGSSRDNRSTRDQPSSSSSSKSSSSTSSDKRDTRDSKSSDSKDTTAATPTTPTTTKSSSSTSDEKKTDDSNTFMLTEKSLLSTEDETKDAGSLASLVISLGANDPAIAADVCGMVLRCLAVCFYAHTARQVGRDGGAYRAYADEAHVTVATTPFQYIHPSSALRTILPKWVVYQELVQTTKPYMRTVAAIEFDWVKPLLPRLLHADPRRLSGRRHAARVAAKAGSLTATRESQAEAALKLKTDSTIDATGSNGGTKRKDAPPSISDADAARARYAARKAAKDVADQQSEADELERERKKAKLAAATMATKA